MADDESQGQEGTARWAFDASADSSLPSATFDEPLVWPETTSWEQPATVARAVEPIVASEHLADLDGGLLFRPESDDVAVATSDPLPDLDVEWQATGHDDDDTTVIHDEPLAGLGGGASRVVSVSSGGSAEPLPESIWAETASADGDIGLISTSAHPTPAIYPAAERGADSPRWRRFDLRQGNAAMIGLISLVSLVLLGMFLSVRARNDMPTDTSQSQRPSDEIAVTGPLNTVPLPTTTVTTTAPAPAINIADLLPATDAGAGTATPGGGSGGSSSGSSGSSSGSGAPATTAAPSRGSGGSSGGGGGSSTPATQPAPAPTPATSPPPVEDTTPAAVSPPVDTTQPRRTTTSITFPTVPSIPSYTAPSITRPGWFNTGE